MIVCRKCSRRYPDGTDFCTCGAFLEFDGEHVADEGSGAVPPPPPGPGPARPAAAPAPPAPPASSPPSAGWDRAPATGRTAEPAPWSGFEPARPAEPAAEWGSVQAQLPDAPLAPASAEPVDVRPTMRIGDVACGRCGTPNPPTRQFCQHCGQELTAAGSSSSAGTAGGGPARSSWWRTFKRKLSRQGISTDPNRLASEAHMLSRGGLSGRSMLFRGGGIAIVLGGFLAFLGPWRGTVTAWARDRLGASRYELIDLEPEQVETVTAVDAVVPIVFPLQEADRTIDRHLNTSWATHWLDPVGQGLEVPPDDGACQTEERSDTYLRFTFPEPTDLARISIIPGRYDGDELRTTFFRPRVVELRWDDQCRALALPDTGELSVHEFEQGDVEAIDLRIVGVYADAESQPTVDIAEVVFEGDR